MTPPLASPVHPVPAAPVLAALLVLSLAVMAWRLHRGGRWTWPRAVIGTVSCLYAVAVVKEVLQPFEIGIDRRDFPGWRAFVHLTPLYGAELSDIFLNALLFLPLGMLLPVLTRVRAPLRVTLLGMLLSLGIEAGQLLLDVTVSVGHIADINDLLGNTLGTLVGSLFLRLITLSPPVRRLIEYMAWPPMPHGTTRTSAATSTR